LINSGLPLLKKKKGFQTGKKLLRKKKKKGWRGEDILLEKFNVLTQLSGKREKKQQEWQRERYPTSKKEQGH